MIGPRDPYLRQRSDFDSSSFAYEFEPNGRFSRGFALALKSWSVIRADRSLLVLPLLQIVTQAAAAVLVIGPIGYEAYRDASRWLFLIGLAAVAFPLNLLATFFGVAFVAVVRAHLDGERMTVRQAVSFAASRLDSITGWALINTFVSVAIAALERVRGGAIAARVVGWILNLAWAAAVLFVIPALAGDRVGPIAAARKSAHVVRQKWPEGIVGATTIGLSFGFLSIPVIVLGIIGFAVFTSAPVVGAVLLAAAVAAFLLVSAAQTAVDGVFRFVLFEYASSGVIHPPFTEMELVSGVKPKRRIRKWLGDRLG